MSSASAFSGLVRAPFAGHAGVMPGETANYDPDSICDNETYDAGLWGVVMGLAWMIASIPCIIWIWPWKGPI